MENILIHHDIDFNPIVHYELTHFVQSEDVLRVRMLAKSGYQVNLPCLWKVVLLLSG